MPGALLGRRALPSRFPDVPRLWPGCDQPNRSAHSPAQRCTRAPKHPKPINFWIFREPRAHAKPPKRRVRPPDRIARPLSNAPVLNRWSRQSRRLSLSAMTPQQAHVVPAHELPPQRRTGHINWIHILLAATGITFASSVAGVVVYNWYFDSVLVGLSSSLQPLSDAFHQLGASHLSHASPAPGN